MERNVLGRLNPSKSMTGLGDRVPETSSAGRTGDASSRGSLAGLLTLSLLLETVPFVFGPLDLLLRFLLASAPPMSGLLTPFGVFWLELGALDAPSMTVPLLPVEGGWANWTMDHLQEWIG